MYLIYMYLKTCEGIVSRNKELLKDAFIIIISLLHVYQMCILIISLLNYFYRLRSGDKRERFSDTKSYQATV